MECFLAKADSLLANRKQVASKRESAKATERMQDSYHEEKLQKRENPDVEWKRLRHGRFFGRMPIIIVHICRDQV